MKILFQGDSITDCGRNRENNCLGKGYPVMVAGELGYAEPSCHTFINKGISGNRVVDVYARIKMDGWNLEPDLISLLIGVNDVWHEVGANHNGVDAVRFEKVLRMLIEDTKAVLPNVKFMLMEPFVLEASATAGHWEYFKEEVALRAAVVKKVAAEYGLSFVPLQDKLNEACKLAPANYWLADGVHPTPAGHRLLTNAWLEVYKRDIAK